MNIYPENNLPESPVGSDDSKGQIEHGPESRPTWPTALGALLAVLLVIAGYGVFEAWRFLSLPPDQPGSEVVILISPGTSFVRVANQLKQAGVITNVNNFLLLGKYRKQVGAVRAGEFRVHTGWTPGRVLDELVYGAPVLHKLVVPEGKPWWEVAALVEQGGFARYEDFRDVIHDPAFLRDKKIPFSSAEGYLFPETYLLQRPQKMDKAAARAVASIMVDMFYRKVRTLWPEGDTPNTVSALLPPEKLGRLIILASLVEKETGVASERMRIAGVYAARLRRGMLLQCDPTTIYGLGDTFDGNLTRKHLRDASNLYNTYRHGGLPPGPICSPGLAALAAALTPEEHTYLYFVARGDGSHQFSRTLPEHNSAVRRYQLRR